MIAVSKAGRSAALPFSLALLAMIASSPVQAQAGNLPYQPGGGAGISYGARQAVLNARLLGVRPRNLMRGADGSLLDVARRGNQVFLRSPETGAFLPGGSPRRGWATGMGTGLGWGGMSSAYGGALSARYGMGGMAAESMMQWISLLDFGDGRYGGLPPGGTVTPLDLWIGQGDWS